MTRNWRVGLALAGGAILVLALGFFQQAGWATGLWPVESGRLSNIFVASIFAAIGAPIIWIAATGETRALAAGGADLLVTNLGLCAASLMFWSRGGGGALLAFAALTAVMAGLCLVLLAITWRVPFGDTRPMPRPLRWAFAAFAILLAFSGGRLVLGIPNTFPWPLSPVNSVFYGWIFLGAMVYFLYGLAVPAWGNTGGQLVGFLAYDLVLIVPFLGHFAAVQPPMLPSLIVYTSVVSASGLIALWYLFADPATRFGAA